MSYFFDSESQERKEIAPGVTIRTMWGDKVMMSVVEVAPHAVVPPAFTSPRAGRHHASGRG